GRAAGPRPGRPGALPPADRGAHALGDRRGRALGRARLRQGARRRALAGRRVTGRGDPSCTPPPPRINISAPPPGGRSPRRAGARRRPPDEKGMHAMDRTALRQALLEMLENNKGEPVERFDDDLNLRTDLGLDSVDLVSLVMDIQERFRVQLAVADLE